ncbi:Trichodiene synthase-domain-containing protein [Rhexocercosporidium sp. MPI-PUGE-AT-0058]|nr:Trichodiene synthase-domain-containing protein [Rhexocercosporidium sp. MPI-PUGE-AT-0058]
MAAKYKDVFVDSLITFLDQVKHIPYRRVTDTEYDFLVDTTMEYFAKEGLPPSRSLCRVGVCASAYVYPTHSLELKKVLSIFFTYMFMIDDYVSCDGIPITVNDEVCRQVSLGHEPSSPFWKSLKLYLPQVFQCYGPHEQLGITIGMHSFWQASMLENSMCDGLPGSVDYPSYLRNKGVMGESCAYIMFPLESLKSEGNPISGQQRNKMMVAIVDCIGIVAGINDIFSFYKEMDSEGDKLSYVSTLESCHRLSKEAALKRVTEDTITLVKRVCGVLYDTGDIGMQTKVNDYIMGLLLQHLLDDRYRLKEVVGHLAESNDSRKTTLTSLLENPEGIWRYDYQPGVEGSSLRSNSTSQKGKGKEVQDNTTHPSTSTTTGQSTSPDGMLVTTVGGEKKKKVFYYFQNEEGGEVQTQESDWKKGTRKVNDDSDRTWFVVDSLNWSTVELHVAILVSCTAAFKALIQRCFPGIFGGLTVTKQSLTPLSYHTQGKGDLRQPRSPDDLKSNSVICESIHEVTENGIQEHIIEDVELSGFNTTVSVSATSETSINDGVIH